jgi:hypothetical protein
MQRERHEREGKEGGRQTRNTMRPLTGASAPLPCFRLRQLDDLQTVHPRTRVVLADFGDASVDDVANAVNSDGGLGNVGRQNDLAAAFGCGLKHLRERC